MKFLKNLFSSTGGGIIESVGNVIDELNLSGEEKQQFALDMERLIQERDAKLQDSLMVELQAKERIIVAEMQQNDNFTKRARPTVVYMGLAFIAINHVLAPWASHFLQIDAPDISLPVEFWVAWGGIVATWSVGRTMEKTGRPNHIAGKPKKLFE